MVRGSGYEKLGLLEPSDGESGGAGEHHSSSRKIVAKIRHWVPKACLLVAILFTLSLAAVLGLIQMSLKSGRGTPITT
jgi:hypothetical protein